MLKIRLRRSGKKNHPQYRIVVAEHTAPIQGKFIDRLGYFNPHTKDLFLDKEKTLNWINNGATPSNAVAKLMAKEKITHPKVKVQTYNKPPKKAAEEPKPNKADTPQEVAQAESAAETAEETDTPQAEIETTTDSVEEPTS